MPEIDLDRELVARLARVYEGNALRHEESAEKGRESEPGKDSLTQHDMLAASSLAIAASYWSLIDANRAAAQYVRAAEKYRALGHGYWVVLAHCSANRSQITTVSESTRPGEISTPLALGFTAISNQLVEGPDQESASRETDAIWRRFGNVPVGRLGIPLDFYMRCARTMRMIKAEGSPRARGNRQALLASFERTCTDYFSRAVEVINLAAHDRFHWQRGLSSILPAEPEAVAVAVAMSIVAHDAFHRPLLSVVEMSERARMLAEVAEDLRVAGTDEEGESRTMDEVLLT